ncbi:MAG TPA: PIN domain-containing protein [Acetobacteraceae bacterium]|nr:PIN domain-containing protein [Acetobacteraceae bacterium]
MLTVLDTDVLSELRLPDPSPKVLAWFSAMPADELALTSFAITEVEYGIARLPARDTTFAAQLTGWLDMILSSHNVLALDAAAARILGRMYAMPPLRNLAVTHPRAAQPKFGRDLVIAATAIAHGAAVATRNIRDFGLIAGSFPQLKGIDPFTGAQF